MEEAKSIGVFVDLDKTLIDGATMLILAPILREKGLISLPTLVRAGIGAKVFEVLGANERRMQKMKRVALNVADGWHHDTVEDLVRAELDALFKPKMFAEAIRIIEDHKKQGHHVVIVSSSPIELVAPVAKLFGIEDVIATRIKLDEDGRCTKEFVSFVSGVTKPVEIELVAIQLGIDLSRSFAYSDSETDIPMLSMVGNPVAINPDRKLERHARANGWEVRKFERPGVAVNKPDDSLLHNRAFQIGAGIASAAGVSVAGVALSRRFAAADR